MKKIPYNSYINFPGLATIFNTNTTPQDCLKRCAFTSITLSARLLGSAGREAPLNPEKIAGILDGIETQFSILASMVMTVEGSKHAINFHSDHLEQLKIADLSHSETIDRITRLYFSIVTKSRTRYGSEDQMNHIRKHFQLPEIAVEIATVCPSDATVTSFIDIGHLTKASYYNAEDELFMTVHQISECWFRIAINELTCIADLFEKEDIRWPSYRSHFASTARILQYLSEHILLLEHMILADYHPLRVALRGASGGQSQQAYTMVHLAKKAFSKFLILLTHQHTSILDILEAPRLQGDFAAMVDHFSRLERLLKNFFFQHYALSSSVIGSQSFGSIGHELVSLSDKFVQPMFQEIDQAKYDLTLKTNFQYGASSGIIILETENFCPKPPAQEQNESSLADCVIDGYFNAISSLDSDKWIQLFDEDGYIEDPVGSRPYIGHRELFVFFKGVKRTFSTLNMKILTQKRDKNCAEVEWSANATSYHGKQLSFSGKEVFQIGPTGKITSAKVYWDPSVVAAQL